MDTLPLQQFDIVLVPFPFSDLSATKVRPAVVVGGYQKSASEITLLGIYSHVKKPEDVFDLEIAADVMTNLHGDSWIRLRKIIGIDQGMILGKLGELQKKDRAKLQKSMKVYFGL